MPAIYDHDIKVSPVVIKGGVGGGEGGTAAAVRDRQCSERRRYSSSMVKDGKGVRVIKDSLCHKINYCQPRSHLLSKHEKANVPR